MTVLVTGATGTTGGEVLRQLRRAGVPVRALTRRPEAAAAFRADGVDAAVGDPGDPATLGEAFDGVDAAYIVNPAAPDLPEREGAFAAAAAHAGVGHLVKLSVVGAGADGPIGFARMHGAAEERIRAAGVPLTAVRPNGFMQNTLAWAAQIPGGTVRGPVTDARWSIVDARDVAAVAVAALRDPDAHASESHVVTGPEATSPREQVNVLSEVLARPLVAEDVPIAAARDQLVELGVPPWTADRLAELFGLYADGLAQDVSPDAERVLGRPPRSYRDFAADHRAAFTPSG